MPHDMHGKTLREGDDIVIPAVVKAFSSDGVELLVETTVGETRLSLKYDQVAKVWPPSVEEAQPWKPSSQE